MYAVACDTHGERGAAKRLRGCMAQDDGEVKQGMGVVGRRPRSCYRDSGGVRWPGFSSADSKDDVKVRLQSRAARHGQSMEAEARDILRDALKDEGRSIQELGSWIAAQFAEVGLKPGETLERPELGEPRNPFEE